MKESSEQHDKQYHFVSSFCEKRKNNEKYGVLDRWLGFNKNNNKTENV